MRDTKNTGDVPDNRNVITLTAGEWERFHALLLHPPQPNERFRRAATERKRIVEKAG